MFVIKDWSSISFTTVSVH